MNRTARRRLAQETAAAVTSGGYQHAGGWVELAPAIAAARRATHLHLPGEVPSPEGGDRGRGGSGDMVVEVTGETTLAAARRLWSSGRAPAALNFASAKHPGGGWSSGALAQEETLARASALVTCLEQAPAFYDAHRAQRHPLYTDRVICSPDVPVFRDDAGTLLAAPYPVTFLTAAAPNAGALAKRSDWDGAIASTLAQRAHQVLTVAASHGHRTMVLGAWGCGVFRNDPHVVAHAFGSLLSSAFAGRFRHVTFAVYDPAPGAPTRAAFREVLRPLTW